MSRPGISTPNSRAMRLSWVKSLFSALPAPGYWIFTATARPSVQTARWTCPMEAAAAGWSSNSAKLVPPVRPEVGGQDLVHGAGGQRRRGLLELGQGGAVRAGDLRRQRRLEDGQGLAELERPALELAQDPEDLLGGALLDLLGDDLGRPAAEPLAEPERGPARQAHRQGGQLGGARDGAARQVTRRISHISIVGYRAESP